MTILTQAQFAHIDRPMPGRAEVAALVSLAARTVAPLWPLESAIAVNPLTGFEDLPFAEAVAKAAARFKARETLPLGQWRLLLQAGRIHADALREAAIAELGGLDAAFAPLGPDLNALDLLMARLIDLPVAAPAEPAPLPPADAFVAKWCAAYFDQGNAASAMPNRELGLYRAVLALAAQDRDFHRVAGLAGQHLLLSVPRDPYDAIAEGLVAANVAEGGEVEWLAERIARLPGWAGHIRWRTEHADPGLGVPAAMADLAALIILTERARPAVEAPAAAWMTDATPALSAHFALDPTALDAPARARFDAVAAMSEAALGLLFMRAAEHGFRDDLVPQLQARALAGADAHVPAAQIVMCIDVRSEPFRRALEAEGDYATLGYAGFFGLPIARACNHQPDTRARLLPVLLAPQHTIGEAPLPGREAEAAQARASAEAGRFATGLFGRAKQGLATAFATAEATGPLAATLMLARTFAPRWAGKVAATLVPAANDVTAPDLAGFTLAEKAGYGALLFRLTGLDPAKAGRLVVLTGHGGETVNNPYGAALDCGACGGHPGGFNARVLAAMLNGADVRERLAAEGMALPETTLFLAAEHNTTTDEVVVFDRHAVPDSHAADLVALEAALARAGAANRARRAASLGRSGNDLLTGAAHWGEVRPEWGLAGNAAFIVGPRWLTAGVDLGGRAFLHSYDADADPDGQILTMILTAPMVVAQWINCQYLFSTIDNDRYGSGDKTTQNPVGRIGVVQGNGGDLRIGLPRQSLFADEPATAAMPYHVPQRLLTVVHAPFDRVDAVVRANPVLMRLFGKGWVRLVAIDPATGKALRWADDSEHQAD